MTLSILILIPILTALLTFFVRKKTKDIATVGSIVLAGFAGYSVTLFNTAERGMQLLEYYTWFTVDSFEVALSLGTDGISYPMILLTALLGVVAVLVSRREIKKDERQYYALLMLLIASIIGVFASLDLIVFFVFWEAVLVLMFLLVLKWGGKERKYAAMKFLVYTGIGSAGLLLVIILLAVFAGTVSLTDTFVLEPWVQYTIFCSLLFAFFIKIPIVPFHTWLPDAHVQAPTAGSILLAGVMLKMGGYGLLRLGLLVVPDMTVVFQTFLFAMGTLTIIYGAWVCLAQHNLKKLIAYSSVNHMGFVLLGIAAGSTLGVTGAVFEMLSHGLIAALLFALAGLVHQKSGTFDIDKLHGLVSVMPRTAWLLTIAALGGLGLPSMTGFIAEFLVLFASFQTFGLWTILPLLGIILTGGYMVRMLSRVVFGKSKAKLSEKKVNIIPFAILTIVIFILGIFPFLILSIITASAFT
ncbi:MAG: NADH-quinone oxidoreductase subunit M [Candidatus Woesearchaeota archaeon]|nr:NADH-quinone oxidoreductase subunit M [Candidatus Woesearchaeota archaeon]